MSLHERIARPTLGVDRGMATPDPPETQGSLILTPGRHSALREILASMLRQLDDLEAEEYNEELEVIGLGFENKGWEL